MQFFAIMSYTIAFVGWLFFVIDDPFSPISIWFSIVGFITILLFLPPGKILGILGDIGYIVRKFLEK